MMDRVSIVKHTLKYPMVCSPEVFKAVIRTTQDSVIKSICNAAFNVEQGDLELSPSERKFFSTYRKQIATLTSPEMALSRKRRTLEQCPALGVALLRSVTEKLGEAKQSGGFLFPLAFVLPKALKALGGKNGLMSQFVRANQMFDTMKEKYKAGEKSRRTLPPIRSMHPKLPEMMQKRHQEQQPQPQPQAQPLQNDQQSGGCY